MRKSFLFTDIVGSMRLWSRDAAAMERALEIHDQAIGDVVAAYGGSIFSLGGDGFGIEFASAETALEAATVAQDRLGAVEWPGGLDLQVRMGAHVGEAQARDGSWFGQNVNIAARVCGAANGGQVLATEAMSEDAPSADLLRLGLFELRGVSEKLALFQLGLHDAFPAPRSIDPTRDTLPEPANALIGRSVELGQIRSMVEANRLVTIAGVGGMGKTRLAIEIAHRLAPTYPDGVYFADLSPATTADAVVNQIAAAVRLELLSGDLREQAVAQIAERSALLVLDNCEHVIDAASAFVSDVIAHGGPGRVLATSRERLGVAGEHQFRLGALSSVEGDGLTDCARLFIDRALAIDASFEVGSVEVLDELLARLDGLPLAIELAAARTSILSVEEIRDRLDDRLALLSSSRAGTGRTLEAMLDWSWQLLDERERAALAAASLFEESFDVELLAAATSSDIYEAMDVVEALVNKSLVSVDGRLGGRTRYHLLESVRAFALVRVGERDDTDAIREALAQGLIERVRAVGEPYASSPPAPNQVLAGDLSSAVAAVGWLQARKNVAAAAELAVHASSLLLSVGRASEANALLQAMLAEGSAVPQSLRGRAQVGLGVAALQMDDFGLAIELAEQLVDDPDPFLRACALGLKSVPGLFGEAAETDELVEGSLAAAAECDDPGVFPHLIEGFRRFSLLDMPGAIEAMAPGLPAAGQPQSVLQTMLTCGQALALVLADRFDEASATLDHLLPGDCVWDTSELLRAVIAARSGDLADAEQRLIEAGENALLGRLSRQPNDVMIGFAVLRAAEGDAEHARSLLADALLPRNVYMFALAAHLAGELDDLLDMLERSRRLRAEQGRTRAAASDALRRELDRRQFDCQ